MKAAKAALQKCPKCPQKAAMKCSRSSPAKAAKAAMKCKAAKAMKVGRPRKCSKVKKAMKVAECSKVKKAMKAMEDWKVAMKAAKVAMKVECSKLKKAMKVVECLKETKWKAGTIPLDLEKLAKAADEGQELGMWLDLWLDEIRTLGATLASASKEHVETRGATITDSKEQVETHSEDWWKRDLPEWVFEEAMATAQKNNLDEGIVQPSGVLPGHVTSAVAQGSASSQ